MTRIQDENESLEQLKQDIDQTNKSNITFFAGHFPLRYIDDGPGKRKVYADVTRWGNFSLHTFEQAAVLTEYAIKKGKEAKIIVLVDDDYELPKSVIETKTGARTIKRDYNWAHGPRRKFYKNAKLPESYKRILEKYNLSEDHLLKQDRNGKESILFSEKILKRDSIAKGIAATNECSLAYKGITLNKSIFDIDNSLLISFMPGQCKGNICEGVLGGATDLDAVHIFYPHVSVMGGYLEEEKKQIYPTQPMSLFYSGGRVTYRRDSKE